MRFIRLLSPLPGGLSLSLSASVLTLTVLLLLSGAHGQGYGNGISKMTFSVSDPRECASFLEKYLPVEEERDSCPGGICPCATQGRVALFYDPPQSGVSMHSAETERETGMNSKEHFGIHAINCSQHETGDFPLKEMEEQVTHAIGN
uniref:Uncharacterized protein n=1 Tax=Chromera velia CCMP2878 TaxID=1169474 RepID=A0A0G4F443_9ALVE|eukprot:Cvel_14991.t1-p1 / transcript=Cvel_14991.t1 / gene=Cvel_14991 / organism=Chromera_velia_CCMP2878 / gene_product=hypothetical protein / transcript_product=hypothetical protein / location=Cvel_scaffold1090:39689-40126(+) / protein_length=146 / sequence_SO=supercontig / SO=protein_coding / is_pseudo=false